MNLVFFSNYYNHHQRAISEYWNKALQGNYTFVSVSKISDQRVALGYEVNGSGPFVCCVGGERDPKCRELAEKADVIIIGAVSEKMAAWLLSLGKLCFRYVERPLKNGTEPLKYLPRFIKWHKMYSGKRSCYLLCAGGFVAFDYRHFGLFKDRALKWGYFPDVKRYDPQKLLSEKAQNRILWCGRFLDWKKPNYAIEIAKKLKLADYDFEMEFIGTGEEESRLKDMVKVYELEDFVSFAGSMSTDMVRSHMEKAGIFLFTSNRKEGWGAVLNEAMNSACAVVASESIGAVPFLIDDAVNGFVFRDGDVDELYNTVCRLLDKTSIQKKVGAAAYETITQLWNAETAANRFLSVCNALNSNRALPKYADGPCSRA